MRLLIRLAFVTVLANLELGCAPRLAEPPKSPSSAPPTAGASGASNWKQVEPGKQKTALVPEPAGVPAPDAECQAFAEHNAGAAACGGEKPARDALASALLLPTAVERDLALNCLESAREFAPGLIRALRADLGPVKCADTIVMPLLEPRTAGLDRRIEDVLIALAAGGQLARLVQVAPEPTLPVDKARFNEFFQSALKPWIVGQAAAIHDLSALGPNLSSYAKGIVAIEAGLADMRFVSVVRQVALPKEMNDDPEIRESYYAALDEALEPRKARGRDAALVGLLELAKVGVLVDPRVERARALLSELYSGRRIDALDELLLPALAAPPKASTEQALAASLPTFYAGFVLDGLTVDAPLLRALLERGLPLAFAQRLSTAQLDDATKTLLVRALIERGRRYLRAEDFASSVRLSATLPATPERALYHALGATLQNGPRDASDVLLHGPLLPNATREVGELDQLAAQKSEVSALAAFDAAYLLSLAPPQNEPKFWDDLGARFAKAARSLRTPEQKRHASELSQAARDTAKALRKPPPPPPAPRP